MVDLYHAASAVAGKDIHMQVNTFWKRFFNRKDMNDLSDLRLDMIFEIAILMFILAWLVVLNSIRYQGHAEGVWVALPLFFGALGIVWLRHKRFQIALALLVASILGAIACQKWLFPDSAAQFFFPLVVVVSSLLVSSRADVFAVAFSTGVVCVFLARLQGAPWLDYDQIILPVLLVFFTAFVAWLGSHQMHTALAWMHNSYVRANELLNELRDERMQRESTLKMLEEAYYRITKLNQALIEARSAAETARRLKAEFAANISHELRTPLNLIIGFSETMANAPETYRKVTWSPTLRGDIEQIYRSSRHLSALIDDILDLSALEAQQLGLTMDEARLEEVIEDAIAVFRNLYQAKKLYLRTNIAPDLPLLRIDITRIRQVLLNLLANAIRFTGEGGVTVTVRLVDRGVEVAVADTGIGIAEQDLGRVFEKFGQVDGSINRVHEGTGLGVPLSKRLVELHGGKLWLESQVGKGTTFYFVLPFLPGSQRFLPEEEQRRSPIPSPAYTYVSGNRDSLLVLEPDQVLMRTIRRQMSNYDVIEVKEQGELAKLIAYHQPVAFLIDAANTQYLADQPSWAAQLTPDLPVVLVSMPGGLNKARSLGIQDYLIKPISREQLLDAIACLEGEIRTVLIADDDPQLAELLSRMLQSSGKDYRILKAPGGIDALAMLKQHAVDLILLDLVMPDISGLDVLQAIKQDGSFSPLSVIVVSGQLPAETGPQAELFLQVMRPKSAAITEIFSCLKSLIAGLPRPEPRSPETESASPGVPFGPPVS
jgi:signal transduction histidine kinase/DNA-binding response OmpR family regulator